jgi:cytidine deaminase
MKTVNLNIKITEFSSVEELNKTYRKLVDSAKKATLSSYSPYSNFKVGAAVLLDNEEIVCGSNQENAAYPSGLCAERVALFYANSKFPENKVLAIAISASSGQSFTKSPLPPCGSCRQVILETENRFQHPVQVILYGEDKIILFENANSLLPISFSEDFLKAART